MNSYKTLEEVKSAIENKEFDFDSPNHLISEHHKIYELKTDEKLAAFRLICQNHVRKTEEMIRHFQSNLAFMENNKVPRQLIDNMKEVIEIIQEPLVRKKKRLERLTMIEEFYRNEPLSKFKTGTLNVIRNKGKAYSISTGEGIEIGDLILQITDNSVFQNAFRLFILGKTISDSIVQARILEGPYKGLMVYVDASHFSDLDIHEQIQNFLQ